MTDKKLFEYNTLYSVAEFGYLRPDLLKNCCFPVKASLIENVEVIRTVNGREYVIPYFRPVVRESDEGISRMLNFWELCKRVSRGSKDVYNRMVA